MAIKPKHQRLVLALLAVAALVAAGLLAASGMKSGASYFVTPTELSTKGVKTGDRVRLGGMVKANSVRKDNDGVTVHFVATDGTSERAVIFRDILPDLFKEGSGMVADGTLRADGVFVADKILAKHDERYMPPQMADKMRDGTAPGGNSNPLTSANRSADNMSPANRSAANNPPATMAPAAEGKPRQ